jgi:hypothetical protein
MYRLRLALFVIIAFGVFAISCAGNKGVSDQSLTTDIQSKLSADAATKSANVNVAVKDGVVTLSGSVPSSDVELEAMKVANGTAGVKSVNDQMKVDTSLASNQPQPAPAQPAPAPPPPAPAAAPTPPPPSPAPVPERAKPVTVTIPAGTELSVRMIDSIDSARNQTGQAFRASLNTPIEHNGRVLIPKDAPVTVLLTQAKSAGRIKGSSELEVRASAIEYKGKSYPVDTSIYSEQGKGRGKQTAIRSGIGAAAGAVIGAIAGGGKGAAIGTVAGGGAGAGFQLATHGQQVKIPSEAVLTFQLQSPLTIRERGRPAAEE